MKTIAYHLGTGIYAVLLLPVIATAIVFLCFATGCATETPQQAIATGIFAVGSTAASDAMTNNPAILPQLQDIAAKLPTINSATLTAAQRGAFDQELQNFLNQLTLLKGLMPADSVKLSDAFAFISAAISQNAALNGGAAPTADQLLATTALTDFADGLTYGIAYYQGAHTVTPPPAPTPPPPST
jgi:hypothetical protein